MFRFVIQKMKNKKWLNLSLAIGILLFMTVFAAHPVLEVYSDNRMLSLGFMGYAKEKNEFPAALFRRDSVLTTDYPDEDALLHRMKQYEEKWMEYVDLEKINSQQILTLSGSSTQSNYGGNNRVFHIGFMEGLEEHTEIVKTPKYIEIPTLQACYVAEKVMDDFTTAFRVCLETPISNAFL